ncbi:MAG: tetratricopeptide repeat protein, partial [Promethearchaeia archaeon]
MPIKKEWRFCKHCNKPLIVNLELSEQKPDLESDQESDFMHSKAENFFQTLDLKTREQLQKVEKKISQKIQNLESIGSLLLEKAGIYYNNRDFSTTLKILREALENFQDEGDNLKIAVTHNQIGLILEDQGFYDEAIYHFANSIKLLKKIQENPKLIKVYNNIANAYYLIQDIEQAYSYYEKALKLAKNENQMDDVIKTNSNLTEILILLNQFQDANQRLQRNLRYFQANKEMYGLINTYTKLGKLFFLKDAQDHGKSLSYLEKALNLIKKVRDQISAYLRAELEWECYFYLGRIYFKQGEIKKAMNYLFLSLDAIRTYQPEESINEASVLETLANVYALQEDYQRSIEYYALANKIYSKFGQEEKIAHITYKLGQIYLTLLETDKALKKFEEAIELYENLDYIKQIAEIHHEIGKIYLENDLIDLAISSFRKARNYYK